MPHNPGKQNVELFPVSFQFFFVLVSEQKCQDRGQKLKFDSIKV
jgi:hypothetical protein